MSLPWVQDSMARRMATCSLVIGIAVADDDLAAHDGDRPRLDGLARRLAPALGLLGVEGQVGLDELLGERPPPPWPSAGRQLGHVQRRLLLELLARLDAGP